MARFSLKILELQRICKKDEYIETFTFPDGDRIRITYEGEHFVKLFPFYNELFSRYDKITIFITGGILWEVFKLIFNLIGPPNK